MQDKKIFWLTIINKNLLIPLIPFNQDFTVLYSNDGDAFEI